MMSSKPMTATTATTIATTTKTVEPLPTPVPTTSVVGMAVEPHINNGSSNKRKMVNAKRTKRDTLDDVIQNLESGVVTNNQPFAFVVKPEAFDNTSTTPFNLTGLENPAHTPVPRPLTMTDSKHSLSSTAVKKEPTPLIPFSNTRETPLSVEDLEAAFAEGMRIGAEQNSKKKQPKGGMKDHGLGRVVFGSDSNVMQFTGKLSEVKLVHSIAEFFKTNPSTKTMMVASDDYKFKVPVLTGFTALSRKEHHKASVKKDKLVESSEKKFKKSTDFRVYIPSNSIVQESRGQIHPSKGLAVTYVTAQILCFMSDKTSLGSKASLKDGGFDQYLFEAKCKSHDGEQYVETFFAVSGLASLIAGAEISAVFGSTSTVNGGERNRNDATSFYGAVSNDIENVREHFISNEKASLADYYAAPIAQLKRKINASHSQQVNMRDIANVFVHLWNDPHVLRHESALNSVSAVPVSQNNTAAIRRVASGIHTLYDSPSK